jgi:hypothetical protein
LKYKNKQKKDALFRLYHLGQSHSPKFYIFSYREGDTFSPFFMKGFSKRKTELSKALLPRL